MAKRKKIKTEEKLNIDDKDKAVLREIVRDPSVSDNFIAKRTKIPVKTVNRRRRKMQERGILFYFSGVNNDTKSGTGAFGARQFVTLYFNYGVSRQQVLDILSRHEVVADNILKKHILIDWIGEKDARVTYNVLLESRVDSDIVEIINVDIIPKLQEALGKDCIANIDVVPHLTLLRIMHNYIPFYNMHNGKLRKDISDDEIFVS